MPILEKIIFFKNILKQNLIFTSQKFFQFIYFMVVPEGENIIDVTYKIFVYVIKPALEMLKEYGNCTETQKREFIYGIDSFIKFLNSKIILNLK
jgi:hypothetical protein